MSEGNLTKDLTTVRSFIWENPKKQTNFEEKLKTKLIVSQWSLLEWNILGELPCQYC